jgi:uncharacterized heparinase superfamily protein
LYWHTLRHLKISQIYNRIKINLYLPEPEISPPPPLRASSESPPIFIQHPQSLTGPDEFIFLGERGTVKEYGWDGESKERLWRYNQHYFSDLNAINSSSRHKWHLELLQHWVEKNPAARGVGWEPYPASLRIVNWVKWALSGNSLPMSCIHSLAVQVRWLSKRLETHLLGNHLLANGKALVFAGLFFQGHEAEGWLKLGLDIINRELPEQVLEDGGHFELSTMYHSIVLEDLLDLINISNYYGHPVNLEWSAIAEKMIFWLRKMIHPDGEISFFNDAAFNIAPRPRDLFSYAQSLGIKVENNFSGSDLLVCKLENSGYIRIESKKAVAILDVASVGPDYLPGHAHADTLSFELSVLGQRLIVNGGTSCYGVSSNRMRERQTASHSTVEINGQSSSEVWGSFRVARRAYPFNLHVFADKNQVAVTCAHNGYRHMQGSPMHQRTWLFKGDGIEIQDIIYGPEIQAVARFIIHPDILVFRISEAVWGLRFPQGDLIMAFIENGTSSMQNGFYAPEFGKIMPAQCLTIQLNENQSCMRLRWE